MLRDFYIFNKSGVLLFHTRLGNPDKTSVEPKLISAFLGSINSWAEMYSSTGVSLFQTGSIRFIFERSIYSDELVFCISCTVDEDVDVVNEKMDNFMANFVHFFWEDKKDLEKGIVPSEKLEQFKTLIGVHFLDEGNTKGE